ncbi:SWF or SNF family helicase [Streptomyces cavernicola]|uniref:SWF or SNF family helicase n=1 Tax=Streptomyces cavernicola TaxID=3043613 RepID=A0ABT6S7P6_9ACTN|nr:SWF or SNF family helicase [Streptomyces sp. B-S-A6]MDI3404133.1 SWF or SNF family helicase [Streptomyces sp. B-S-A6]
MSGGHDERDEWYDEGLEGAAEERTFAALPPAHGRGFAVTWWGQAWLKALEDTALDNAQLKAGRRLARSGAVGAVSVRPGRITAVVSDRDRTGHRSDVLLQRLTDDEWDRFLDMAVERAGHIAALLDREMPPHLVEDAAAAGVELLPGIGDLEPECSCDAWDHCAHTAALSYQLARLLDQDPFVLLLLRGRGERALLDDLQVRSVARAAQTGQDEPERSADSGGREREREPEGARGVPAGEAYATGGILPPLPPLPVLPESAGTPPSLDTETAPAPGVDASAVEFLAAAATAEAHRALAEALAPGHAPIGPAAALTVAEDAVRLAVDAVRLAADAGADADVRVLARLAEGTGRDREGLRLAVLAWELGGAAGLAVLEEVWTPQGETAARARAALESAWEEGERPALRADRNRWTLAGGGAQLRLGRDGRWWPYRKVRGRWVPAGDASQDPATGLAGAGEG